MIRHFVVEPWAVREVGLDPATLPAAESLFALSNGYLGMRGNLDEGAPTYRHGTYVNGFFESFTIVYPETAYGYARTDQVMLNLPDGKIIRLEVDGSPFSVRSGTLLAHTRTLDLRAGTLVREAVWTSPQGRTVRVRSTRMVALSMRNLAVIRYEVTPLDGPATLALSSELVIDHTHAAVDNSDPRAAATGDADGVLLPGPCRRDEGRYLAAFSTQCSRMSLVCGTEHVLEDGWQIETVDQAEPHRLRLTARVEANRPIGITKLLAYHTARHGTTGGLWRRVNASLDAGLRKGFDRLVAAQRRELDRFWSLADVVVEGNPALQNAVRFALFQLHQASASLRANGIPAKGLTGLGYEGQYFWDQETYVLSVLDYVAPKAAAQVLRFRHATLPMARRRARALSEEGALFPWRTIDGEAASAYFPAGTAAYHINADIAHAVSTYVDVTGDVDLLDRQGAEMLVETARLWRSLGFFSERRNGQFCIHGVTGPDEYSALVDNNTYTNLMAKANLSEAARVVEEMSRDRPQAHARLVAHTGLDPREVVAWRDAAERMFVPYDAILGVHGQDDGFLDLEPWDKRTIPRRRFPLLLHYHPLVLYRRQIVKQADLVMAMFLRSEEFTAEQKRRNFDYYDPITTGDSSLSAPIQAIMAAEVGHLGLATRYLEKTAFVDVDDLSHNVKDGVHMAAMAGTWLALVHGFAGLREAQGTLSFTPRLPRSVRRLAFSLLFRGRRLDVDLRRRAATYTVSEGSRLEIHHHGTALLLPSRQPVSAPIPGEPAAGP